MENRIVVCVPSGGDWKAQFGMSLAHLVGYEARRNKLDVAVLSSRGSILPNIREAFLKKAQHVKADWMLYLDSDMQFPMNTLERLMAARVNVIGAAASTKEIPGCCTAWLTPDEILHLPDCKRRVQRVWRVGTAVFLIRTATLASLPSPRFPMDWREEAGCYQGEDWGLCDRLDDAQIPIYVETELSREIGHIGDFSYAHPYVKKLENPNAQDPKAAKHAPQLELAYAN